MLILFFSNFLINFLKAFLAKKNIKIEESNYSIIGMDKYFRLINTTNVKKPRYTMQHSFFNE